MEPKQQDPSNVEKFPGVVDEPPLRLPPENLEAEQALLGSILVNNAAYHRISEFLKGEHFANALHGKLYDALARLVEKGQVVSVITLKTYLEQDEAMKEAGGAAYLAALAAASVHVIDAEQFGRVIHDLYLRRQLIALGHDVVNGAYLVQPPTDVAVVGVGGGRDEGDECDGPNQPVQADAARLQRDELAVGGELPEPDQNPEEHRHRNGDPQRGRQQRQQHAPDGGPRDPFGDQRLGLAQDRRDQEDEGQDDERDQQRRDDLANQVTVEDFHQQLEYTL